MSEDQLPVLSCPRCSVGEISPRTLQCSVCSFSSEEEMLTTTVVDDEVFDTVSRELSTRFALGHLLRKGRGTLLYEARDLEREEPVALQLLPLAGPVGADLLHTFESATAVARDLRHPHLIGILGAGYTRSLLWYSTMPDRHTPLSERFGAECPMPLDRCMEVLEQVGNALDYLHRRGMLHGALVPEAVETDDRGWIRVADASLRYELARGAGLRSPWRKLLDPLYSSPEVLGHRTSGPAADQYALAATAMHCLVGAPAAGQPPAELASIIRAARPDLPDHIVVALVRAHEDKPLERFPSVMEFLASLTHPARSSVAAHQPLPWRPSHEVLMPSPGRRIGGAARRTWALAGGAVAVVAAASWFWATRSEPVGENAFVTLPSAVRPVTPERVQADSAAVTPELLGRVPSPTAAPARPPTRRSPVARPPGRLFVNSTPWGVVYLDGEQIGNTPRADLSVPAGVHILRIVRDGYEPFERQIRVTAGEELRLTEIVLEPIQP